MTLLGEKKFCEIFTRHFANKQQYEIQRNPSDFSKIYGGEYGAKIKLAVFNKDTQKKVFVVLKRQSDNGGNAHERVCMYLTVGMINVGREKGKIRDTDYPFWLLFWDDLAIVPKYRYQIKFWFQGLENSITLWKDISDENPIIEHFEKHIAPRLR